MIFNEKSRLEEASKNHAFHLGFSSTFSKQPIFPKGKPRFPWGVRVTMRHSGDQMAHGQICRSSRGTRVYGSVERTQAIIGSP